MIVDYMVKVIDTKSLELNAKFFDFKDEAFEYAKQCKAKGFYVALYERTKTPISL